VGLVLSSRDLRLFESPHKGKNIPEIQRPCRSDKIIRSSFHPDPLCFKNSNSKERKCKRKIGLQQQLVNLYKMKSLSYSIKYEEAECWTLPSPHSINFNPVGIVVRHSAYSLYIFMKSRLHAGIFEVQKQMCRPIRTYINLQYIKANLTAKRGYCMYISPKALNILILPD